MKKLVNLLPVLLLLGLLGCGGGGDSEEPSVNQPPNAVVPSDFSTTAGATVSLDGSASNDSDGSIVAYTWIQTSGTPTVSISNNNSAQASFVAPDVSSETLLTFTLTVVDNLGETDSAIIIVLVMPNQPPTAKAPNDFSAVGESQVALDGSQSEDDNEIVSYTWEQLSGENVTLSASDSAIATFTAPVFDANQTKTLVFRLTVTDSFDESASDEVTVTIVDTLPEITLSGNVTYDRVPFNPATQGLDYLNTQESPVRGATIELLNANNSAIVASSTTDANGDYSFVVEPMTDYIVRVKAELKKPEPAPTWDFTVVDNTSEQALYAMDSAVQNILSNSKTLNLNADSGWGGTSYTSPRVAAPFAILDDMYRAKEKFLTADAQIGFPALKLNWSVNNVAVDGDKTIGEIETSHFGEGEIFILGNADSDTDEYDDHVITHEWGHYFEAQLSRSDNIGGLHSQNEKLDMRIAFGEGFGNALSGIITDDPIYRDSFGTAQSQGFSINVENNPSTNQGWFSEASIQSILYDLYDNNNDGADNVSLGLEPLYSVLVNEQKTTEVFTSIHTFAHFLKQESPNNVTLIDNLLNSQNIKAADAHGTTETNNGGDSRNLPIYKELAVGGGAASVCSFASNGLKNKLGNRQYLALDIATGGIYEIVANGNNNSDPDIIVFQQGNLVKYGDEEEPNTETLSVSLQAGKYIVEIYDYTNIGGNGADSCFNVTISQN